MTVAEMDRSARNPFERLFDALIDPARCERVMALVLACYAAVWSLYGFLAKSSQDIHSDMAEIVIWSREPALGYTKHPPLAAWVAKAWFALFPVADWPYYLLAMVTVAVALWIAWRLSAWYLPADKRVVALALLTLIPLLNFQALKFNANTVLLPLWAATTFAFLRSYESRSVFWSALAGVAAAAAMLGKYWSIFLLLGLALAALLDSRRGAYFRSPAPWITILVGAVLIAPHFVWLINHDFVSFSYAMALHGRGTWLDGAESTVGYILGGAGYVALPAALIVLAGRPDRATLADLAWPKETRRRLVALAFWGPLLLLPILAALVGGIEINSLWTMSAWTLFGVMLLSPQGLNLARENMLRIFTFACVLPFIMVALAPAVAIAIHLKGVAPVNAHASLLADPIERLWSETTDKPLRIVGGDYDFANQLAFYLPSAPTAFIALDFSYAPWINPARLAREGLAIVCDVEHPLCVARAEALAAANSGSRHSEITVARRFAGTDGPAARYLILAVPPR